MKNVFASDRVDSVQNLFPFLDIFLPSFQLGTKRKRKAQEFALDHFDVYYKPVFKSSWPSIRVALLSLEKQGVLVNRFSRNALQLCDNLFEQECVDILSNARSSLKSEQTVMDQSKTKT